MQYSNIFCKIVIAYKTIVTTLRDDAITFFFNSDWSNTQGLQTNTNYAVTEQILERVLLLFIYCLYKKKYSRLLLRQNCTNHLHDPCRQIIKIINCIVLQYNRRQLELVSVGRLKHIFFRYSPFTQHHIGSLNQVKVSNREQWGWHPTSLK